MDQTSEAEKTYQRNKYNEILEILLTTGYFRVRINTLSEFDKVVGGLCWCITSSGEVVDVDILFQENSTIGQKITLAEAVVKALRKMGCPCPLQPHQIQGGVGGSDYPALYQVIVWLVKKYFERRGERELQLRAFSTFQFSKNYQLPTEVNEGKVSANLAKILSRNKAVRLFKRREFTGQTVETRVRACLIEFGETFTRVGNATESTDSQQSGKHVCSSQVIQDKHESSGRKAVPVGGTINDSKSAAEEIGKAIVHQMGKLKSAGVTSESKVNDSTPSNRSTDAPNAFNETDKLKVHIVPMTDSADMTLAGLSKLDSTELSKFEKQLAKVAREAIKEDQIFAEQVEKEESELLKQMSEIDSETAPVVSGSQVGSIVGLGSSEIGSALAAYKAEMEESKKQIDSSLASGKLGKAAAYNRQKQSLLKQRDEFISKEESMKVVALALQEKVTALEEERNEAREYIEQLKAQMKKLLDFESAASQQSELKVLKDLIDFNESLRAQEAAFKASCKAQMLELANKLQTLEKEETEETEENKKFRDIEEMHEKVFAKYNKLRQLLADTNLEVANVVRTIDDIPTRTELIQYERRFAELYQQISWKLEETRKYYAMYNTLDTTLGFIQKEIKLLNSISENFNDAMKSSQAKAEFSKQFENIVRGVEDSLKRQETQLATRDKQVEELKASHQQLVDEQRKYFKAVKDFQEECNKNDWLTSKLEQLTHA